MENQLPPLPYDYAALEPYIDEQTLHFHHDKHHATYFQNLQKALADHPDLQQKSLEELLRQIDDIPESIRTAVRNNGGQHFNHIFYWESMTPDKNSVPTGELATAINATFGGLDTLKDELTKSAVARFGSGWAWLARKKDGQLVIYNTANEGNPLMLGDTPLLTVDVWEHAYYLKYQNRRADYVAAWWNVVNWNRVSDRYAKSGK